MIDDDPQWSIVIYNDPQLSILVYSDLSICNDPYCGRLYNPMQSRPPRWIHPASLSYDDDCWDWDHWSACPWRKHLPSLLPSGLAMLGQKWPDTWESWHYSHGNGGLEIHWPGSNFVIQWLCSLPYSTHPVWELSIAGTKFTTVWTVLGHLFSAKQLLNVCEDNGRGAYSGLNFILIQSH